MAKRVFIAFAIEDEKARNLLKGQEVNPQSPIDYVDMSVKEPWSEDWKTKCRQRIKGCDGVIALLSRNSVAASGQRWEIKCAVDEKVPIIGVYISTSDTSAPPEIEGVKKVYWTWDGIAAFITSL
jgi:nucleoside 2-deoxyribosyltransferase